MPIRTFEEFRPQISIITYDVSEVADGWFTDADPEYFPELEGEKMERMEAGMNRDFFSFPRPSIHVARDVCETEARTLVDIEEQRIGFLENSDQELTEIESGYGEKFWLDFDFGVRGAVMAIAAVGGYPFTSCNAGSFTDDSIPHNEPAPTIAFFANKKIIGIIEKAAKKNDCGLGGMWEALSLGTTDIRNFNKFSIDLLNFAEELGIESAENVP
tara:strand:- start:193 stop:837 length:645 start_codon:yes stop_codon:yes gene_type:complete